MLIADWLWHAAREEPQFPFFVEATGAVISRRAFADRIARLQDRLTALGVAPGQLVALRLREDASGVAVLLAVLGIGARGLILNRRLPPGRQRELGIQAGVHGWIQDHRENPVEEVRSLIFAELPPMDLQVRPAVGGPSGSIPPPSVLSEDAQILLATSGSSGPPKLAALTWKALVASARAANARIPQGPGDLAWMSLPLYHVGGLGILVRAMLAGSALGEGGPQVKTPPPGVTHFSAVPSQLATWSPPSLQSAKSILLGGAPLPIGKWKDLLSRGLPLYASYGLTEMASMVATSRLRPEDADTGVVYAEPVERAEVRIALNGEILVRGPSLFSGYLEPAGLRRPEVEGGFFPTGDTGELDDRGSLRVTGRLDFLIISGGENIRPEGVESEMQRLNGVEEAVVVGVPDERWGSRPWAFVRASLPEEELRQLLLERLPSYMVPDRFLPWPADLTAGMKVPRAALRDLAVRLAREKNNG